MTPVQQDKEKSEKITKGSKKASKIICAIYLFKDTYLCRSDMDLLGKLRFVPVSQMDTISSHEYVFLQVLPAMLPADPDLHKRLDVAGHLQ